MLARAKPAGDLLDDSRSRVLNRLVGGAGIRFRGLPTFTNPVANGQVAPIAAVPATTIEPRGSTESGPTDHLH